MGWFSKAKDGFFLSTTTPEGIDRSQYLGVVNGEAIIGANIFRDMFAPAATSGLSRARATRPWKTSSSPRARWGPTP